MIKYGFTAPTSELERILGLTPGSLARTGLDMDLADHCRMMTAEGVDLHNEAAVRKFYADRNSHGDYPSYANALVMVAKTYREEQQ